MPKISAVMALYNTEFEFLKPTIESVLAQNFKDFELIVIDDASTIEYKDFFKSFNDKRIKYQKLEKNSGPGHARNVGIKMAKGKYVAILDSDDIYFPDRFNFQMEFLENNPDIDLVGCSVQYSSNKRIPPVFENNEEIKVEMLFNSQLANPAVMFRKDVFIEKNLFYPEDRNFGEDYELWVKAMFKGIKIANLKDVLMIYTRRPGQLSKTVTEKQITILKIIYKNIFDRLNMQVSLSEIDLHHNIYQENFKSMSQYEISDWFDKIIEHNKKLNMFDKNVLINKKNKVLDKYKRFKNRAFKIKIGEHNFCMSKDLKFYIEKRNV